ncbi:cbb3-type cytochrome c oxidase N-terminal domain-containing protein [Botrimarina sp.]|uniref:cbb3-type cytochrome c oxidase N-terminal domain-containing protein n=1 Tax=Botrimarina sp. TaxID=2795802 RepID=UPI0032EF0351
MADEPKVKTPLEPAGDDVLSGHTYDGIQEYDNPTPRWWELLFVGSILFSPLYILWFHAPAQNRTLADQYEASLAANLRLQFGELGDVQADEPTLVRFMNEPEWLKVGASTFAVNCASCHGKDAAGISGPNLTDDYYIHVKDITDIAKVLREGAKNGAMPAWENRLHPTELILTAAYVASLRGQNLEGRYAEKGNEIPPWPGTAAGAEAPAEPSAVDANPAEAPAAQAAAG